MSDTNKKTLESYETSIDEYIQNTPNKRGAVVEDWIDKSTEALKPDAKILEIGSAYGRDAKIIEEKGFRVEKTDATKGFVDILRKEDPSAHTLNILTDDLPGDYDLIIANAVFLHFNDTEVQHASKKVFDALNADGVFALTLKQGDGEAWQDNKGMGPRYFNYWSKDGIVELLSKTGFASVDAWIDSSDSSSATWVMILAKKAKVIAF